MQKFDFYHNTDSNYIETDNQILNDFDEFIHCHNKLNLGSNVDCRNTHINVDILDLPDLDLRCDILDLPLYLKKNHFKEILAYDVLEHFPFSQTTKLLTDWVSWLAPEGKIIVRVPDMEKLAHALIEKKIPSWEVGRLIYGGQDYEFNFHKSFFTGDFLEGLLIGAGCSRIVQVVREFDSFNVTIVGIK